MRPVWFRVVRWSRRHVAPLVLLMLVVAVMGGVVLALAAGAQRTSTAPDRYAQANDTGIDVGGMQDQGRPRTAELAALPGVDRARSMSFVFGGLVAPDIGEYVDGLVFAGDFESGGARLSRGRAPDPHRPGEFVMTRAFAEDLDLSLGDHVTLRTLTQTAADTYGFDPRHADGPVVDGVLVGMFDAAALLDDPSAITIFSPALLDDERIGIAGTVLALELADGVTLDDIRSELSRLPEPELFVLDEAVLVSGAARTAVRGQGLGLWLLAGLAALVTIAAIGQLLARSLRPRRDEVTSLVAIGSGRRQLVGEASLRAALVVVPGMALAIAGAVAVSDLFPFGFVRPLEPDRGIRVEVLPLLLAALVVAVGLVGWVAVATHPRPAARPRPPSSLDAVVARCPTTSMATGVRFAFTSRSHPGLTSAGIAGSALLVAATVGTLTFAVSLQRLVDERARYGANYDVLLDNGADGLPPTTREVLETNPNVAAYTLYTAGGALVGDSTIPMVGMEPVTGDLTPPVLSGRLPRSSDEVALGRRSARQLGVGVGEELELVTESGRASYRVTAIVTPPLARGNDLVGQGAVLTTNGFARLVPDAAPNAVAVDLRDPVRVEQVARLADELGVFFDGVQDTRPAAILNLARITFVPFVLAGLLAVLTILVVVNSIYTGVRRRDRQVAVLRALGADGPWVVRTALWQAVAVTVALVVIGAPLGFLAGALAFRALAEDVGTIPDAAIPVVLAVLALAALGLFGMLAAAVAGRPTERNQPAPLLRAG